MEKYNRIGNDYNSTRKADQFILDRLYYFLKPKDFGKYLDIGCGTGNYTIALSKFGLNFTGVEPSNKMLLKAKEKDTSIDWNIGTAEDLPFENNSFDGAIATLTIHHWIDIEKGLNEVFRVLKPKSRFVIFTSTSEQMKNYWLNIYFPKMMQKSINQMPTFSSIKSIIKKSGFTNFEIENYKIKDDLQDQFLYIGKNNPKIYFDENIRKGISSFADLANQDEVKYGIKQLQEDLENGNFESKKQLINDDIGDYLFVIAEK